MDSFDGSDIDSTDSLRGSGSDQLYGSTKPGPIRLGVADWLNTLGHEDAEEEETTENPDMILMLIKSKTSAVEQMREQLATLTGGQEVDSDLKKKVDEAQKAAAQGEADLQQAWTQSTLSLATILIKATTSDEIARVKTELCNDIKTSRGIDDDNTAVLLDQVVDQVKNVNKQREDLAQKREALGLAQEARAQATATDTGTQEAMLRDSIKSSTLELDGLNARYNAAKASQ